MIAVLVVKRVLKLDGRFTVNDKKPSTKLFTWKYGFFIGAIFIVVVAFKLFHDYKLKGYLEGSDLTSAIVPLIPLIVILLAVGYWGNRSEKRK